MRRALERVAADPFWMETPAQVAVSQNRDCLIAMKDR